MPRPTKAEALDALLRTRLAAFTQKTFRTVDPGATYLHNWHIDLIAEYLEACTRREIKRLIINIPPRYLKSISVSVAWPAWLLGKNPSQRIIAASYSDRLSLKHSVDCRLVMQSEWYRRVFPGVILTGDQNEKSKFVTTARGQRFATSVGGTATGDGGNFLIVDDPHNPTQALSPVQRETALTWFDQTFSNRLDDKANGVIVVVMQRLHANDLSGHLLAKGGWEHLCIPGVAETKTVIDFGRVKTVREPGDVLHPARESSEAIDRQKIEMGSYAFAGQYQQRPAPAEGGIFKADWFKRYAAPQESYEQIVQSWDTAFKPNQINDPSACTTWGVRKDGFDLLHVLARRMEYPDLKSLTIRHAAEWNATAVLIEDKASGQSLIQDLRRETQLPVVPVSVSAKSGDKTTRASAVSAMVEAGRLFLPRHAPWLTDYEAEMLTFPNANHDDQVDSTTQFLEWIRSRAIGDRPFVRRL
jgi:predicted phage terminase large subunit-like protein